MTHNGKECYTTKTDALEREVLPALGDWAEDYDLDELFDRLFYYDEGARGFKMRDVDFWETAAACDKTEH